MVTVTFTGVTSAVVRRLGATCVIVSLLSTAIHGQANLPGLTANPDRNALMMDAGNLRNIEFYVNSSLATSINSLLDRLSRAESTILNLTTRLEAAESALLLNTNNISDLQQNSSSLAAVQNTLQWKTNSVNWTAGNTSIRLTDAITNQTSYMQSTNNILASTNMSLQALNDTSVTVHQELQNVSTNLGSLTDLHRMLNASVMNMSAMCSRTCGCQNPCPAQSTPVFGYTGSNRGIYADGRASTANYLSRNFASLPSASMPGSFTEFTVEFWMNDQNPSTSRYDLYPVSYSTAHVSGGSSNALLVNARSLALDSTIYYQKYLNLFVGNRELAECSATIKVTRDWHHYAFVYKRLSTLIANVSIFVDGEAVVDRCVANIQSATSGGVVAGRGNLVLFQEQDAHGGSFDAAQALTGMIDEFRLWTVARTAAQIFQYFTVRGPFTPITSLVGAWSFENNVSSYPPGNDFVASGTTSYVPFMTQPPNVNGCGWC
eukprot:m.1637722 g.1637722  ORF g.1637722 m.1637722 type:complete len:490 (+) comp26119_c0_seq1:126-1595(+)